ncbi:N-acetylglucosamine-6-phosphate deacetylase [Lactobacillus agilis]|uniref:N-acetylglucosamine-6-phosphate deacetylase n=1 Tax=Ligilactobacillus agilis TaxID=1601 RepID=A0A848C8X8_9LACO|nr:N-acetylglucosamine-6-phosphate deacetylase [Ligilactobacillus agilis]NME42507.1 N-acetylglucosamine-6-phosphate deacetylase [Ligilactobacillus agilis]
MATVLKHAKIYTGTEVIADGYIRFDKEIQALGPVSDYQVASGDQVVDLAGKVIVPGFIDVHCHGGYSFDTMDGDAAGLDEMVNDMVKDGVTTIFPTTMTQSPQNIKQALEAVAKVAKQNPVIQGIHLEGPYISPVFKGAQPEEYIKAPDVKQMAEWNQAADHLIRLVTYAPEHETAREFEEYCLANKIVPSVGHSNATREQMHASKASHVTHLYNAQREFKHREPGVTGHAMLENDMYCELIADGFHVCPDMIKLAYELKGADKLELITDSMRAKGMPEGISELGGQKVIVKDKQARLESGNLAGSVLTYDDAFVNIMKFTGCSVQEAIKMSSLNQAKEFGLSQKGSLEVGKDADLNVFDFDWNLKATYSYGRLFHK